MTREMVRLDSSNDASTLLNLLRALMAQVVCLGHAGQTFGVYSASGPQILAVMVFFLLSGFVIAHTLSKQEHGFTSYAIDRFSRIYSAYLPAVLLVLVVDAVLVYLGKYEHTVSFTAKHFYYNVVLLQGYPNVSVGAFGSGVPFWTISPEFHFYLFVGAVYFIRSKYAMVFLLLAIVLCRMPLAYVFDPLGDRITGLFGLWLLGFGCYYMIRTDYLHYLPSWLLGLVGVVSTWYVMKHMGGDYDIKLYVPAAVSFLAVTALATRTHYSSIRIETFSKVFAGYSFSLYLTHFTVIYALSRLLPGSSASGAFTAFFVANVFAFGFAQVTEKHYKRLATWIKRYSSATYSSTSADPRWSASGRQRSS